MNLLYVPKCNVGPPTGQFGLSRWPSGLRRRLEGPSLFGGREIEPRLQDNFEKIWRILHTLKENILFFFTFCYFVFLTPLPLTLQAILDVHLFVLFCSEEGPKFSKLVQHWI